MHLAKYAAGTWPEEDLKAAIQWHVSGKTGAVWNDLKNEAREELEGGHRAAQPLDWHGDHKRERATWRSTIITALIPHRRSGSRLLS
jgi:hypothetical protein